ncbi:hypothetical protein B0H67DRAFT_215125 [Lasiosphaeris hirsuta]|uniref:Uncharacterized protein n=1 Tax=Lasiosphaeris hirsuta TaxID=260670 RepID=A0AA40AEY8_9PEZI|nr:hypothetical protein B0H67DRAFT_215125 [Lasiosphaeris hirsuta]
MRRTPKTGLAAAQAAGSFFGQTSPPSIPLPTRLDSNIPENSCKVPGGSHYRSNTPSGAALWPGRRGRARSALATVTRVDCARALLLGPMTWLSVGGGRGGWEKMVKNLYAATENPCLAMCTCFAIGPAKWRCMSSELTPGWHVLVPDRQIARACLGLCSAVIRHSWVMSLCPFEFRGEFLIPGVPQTVVREGPASQQRGALVGVEDLLGQSTAGPLRSSTGLFSKAGVDNMWGCSWGCFMGDLEPLRSRQRGKPVTVS